MKDLSQEGQRKRSLMSEPKVAVPEPVSPEGSGPCICHQGPGSVGALRPCPVHGVTAAPEAAAEDVAKSYNDFLRKYYPATAEKLIAESPAPIAPAALCEDEGCPHHGTMHVCISQNNHNQRTQEEPHEEV